MIKRCFDIGLVVLAAPIWLPVMCVVALFVRLKLGTPILFRQKRPGLHGCLFELLKFRTMRDAVGADGCPLPDAERLGLFGRRLRASSLDELPELFNVLRGEMSLVGPRPLLVDYLPRFSAEQARRHAVLPGITGWAQINGRNAISWNEKFRLDVWYVDHRSVWLDLKILISTFAKVVARDGISAQGEATMPEFTGGPDAGGAALPGNRGILRDSHGA